MNIVFGTVALSGFATAWKEVEGKILPHEHFADIEALREVHPEIDMHAFEVDTSLDRHSGFSASRYVVLDAVGAPLWKGARVDVRSAYAYLNLRDDVGSIEAIDVYGGCKFHFDEPYPIYFEGFRKEDRQDVYQAISTYVPTDPVLGGYRVLVSGVGDPHEHGRQQTYVRLLDDPRSVCTPLPKATAAP